MKRQRYFLNLLSDSLQTLLSFFLTLVFVLCLVVLWQGERIGSVARWLEAEPHARARMLQTLLEKSEIIKRVSVASIETADLETIDKARQSAWRISDVSFDLASGIEVRFRRLTFEGKKIFANIPLLPRSLRVEGLRILVPLKEHGQAKTETQRKETQGKETQRKKSREQRPQRSWHRTVQQVGFIASLVSRRSVVLQDSLFLVTRKQQPLLRLRFEEIAIDSRNGLTWRGHGVNEAASATSHPPVTLRGSYAVVSGKLYQSLRIENFPPQELLKILAFEEVIESDLMDSDAKEPQKTSKATRLWLARPGQFSLDYRLDLREDQSWLRLRFVQKLPASDKKATLSFDRSTDSRRTGWTNTSVAFRALPLGIVWRASDLLLPAHLSAHLSRKALPFRLSGIASGSLSLQQQPQLPSRFVGNLSLETPRLQWNEAEESVTAHQLALEMKGSEASLQIQVRLDLDKTKESRFDKSITILPYEEGATQRSSLPARTGSPRVSRKKLHPSRFRLVMKGASRGSVPVQTVIALWAPRFKPKTRATILEVVKEGEVGDVEISLDVLIDVEAKTQHLTTLEGGFLWQKGHLQLFASQATLTDVEARARFTPTDILFKVKRARYGDFFIDNSKDDSEVSFARHTLANNEKHTLMRLTLFGKGGGESLRRFIFSAPFLQNIEILQRTARVLPAVPSAQARGHFNLLSFIEQLSDENTGTVFPHPFSYDTAWQVENIRMQVPFLRFYEGEATLVSTSAMPLDLTLQMTSERGANLKGRWRIANLDAQAVQEQEEVQHLTLEGLLDAKALASDFAYLPREWLEKDLPSTLTYREQAGAASKGLLTVAFPRARLRVESLQPLTGEPVRLFGSIDSALTPSAEEPAWQIEGTFRPQGEISLLLERGRADQKERSLVLLLERPKPSRTEKRAKKKPVELRISLTGEKLDLSRWVEQKPWQIFVQELQKTNETPPALGWGKHVNLKFDARVKRLQLHKTTAEPLEADLLQQVRASLRWKDGKIRDASFFTHGGVFLRSEKRQRKQNKRRVRTQGFYSLREGKEIFSVQSADFGSFLHQAAGKDFAEGGKAQIALVRRYRERQRPKPHLEGYIDVQKISLYNLPLLLKIFDAVNFVSAFRKGIKNLDVQSGLEMWNGTLTLKDFLLGNNLTALSANGSLDLREQKLDLRGEIASLHLISKILRNIPLIGTIVVGRKRHNLFAFSYEAKGEWDKPKVTASPLNILLPGIIKITNPLQLLKRDEIKEAKDKEREAIAREQQESEQQEREQQEHETTQGTDKGTDKGEDQEKKDEEKKDEEKKDEEKKDEDL